MSNKKITNSIIETEDMEENFEDGFSDYIPGPCDNTIFEMSFEDNNINTEETKEDLPITNSNTGALNETPLDPSSIVTKARGLTPPINGEPFDIKRGYQFRASTIKKLNQLKGSSDNINIYLNEIIDNAICFYYNSIFNNK